LLINLNLCEAYHHMARDAEIISVITDKNKIRLIDSSG